MKKFLMFSALAIAAMANEVQVFTSNTMRIELDNDSKIEKLFFGKTKEFYEKQGEILKDLQKNSTSALAIGTIATLQASSGEIAKNIVAGGSGAGGVDTNGGLIAIGAMVAIAGGKALFDYAREDHEYMMMSKAINSKGEETLLYTLIVANNSLETQEGEEMALGEQKKLLKDK